MIKKWGVVITRLPCHPCERSRPGRVGPLTHMVINLEKDVTRMFFVVLLISGAIGSVVLLNVSLITLAVGLVGFPFTFLYAITIAPVLAVFSVLTGHREEGEGIANDASKTALAPLSWALKLIAFMWVRLDHYLFTTPEEETRQGTRANARSRSTGARSRFSDTYGFSYDHYEYYRRAANLMMAVTVFFDIVGTILLVRFL
jgi:hypothetical protein